jgi:hypothetical protein
LQFVHLARFRLVNLLAKSLPSLADAAQHVSLSNVGAHFAIASHSAIRAEHSVTATALFVDMKRNLTPRIARACM